ncbi:hypothetical protein GCM10028778_19510 [Barrientosiimonas marina]|uniref:Uncharacterized protein n=1 Tax=Lentibacillus kimchii TaxID=1542911 RepID=A0ABW2UPX7_9BACI
MLSTWVLVQLTYMAMSIAAGLVLFYVTSQAGRSEKKQQLEESVSLIVNFILYIWAGKIVLNIAVFVTDPLAVLAYPSDANAFYIAVLLLLVNIGYTVKRHKKDLNSILSALVPIFLGSGFVYEFIEIAAHDNMLASWHLGLFLILLVVFLFLRERQVPVVTSGFVLGLWSLGQFILTFQLPYTALYGYTLSRWFMVLVFVLSIISLYITNREKPDKGVTEHN